jgi:hypothetical protein
MEKYEKLYNDVLEMSMDADGFSSLHPTEEEIEKCKWIAAILEVLEDVPMRKMMHIFKSEGIEFDYQQFLVEQDY